MQIQIISKITNKKILYGVIVTFLLIIVAAINGAGLYIGNIIYQQVSIANLRWNGENSSDLDEVLIYGIREKGWEEVRLTSSFGYLLHGIFIANPKPTNKTIIFLHGFTESCSVGLNYLELYQEAGFNILLVDSRAHGESGGNTVTWGAYEKYDINQWVDWVQGRFLNGRIGIHGVSMGAVNALLHAELNETNKQVDFYIADSAYSDFETLLIEKTAEELELRDTVLVKILLQYANIIAYCKSGFTFYQSSPIQVVKKVTTPVLYIHGEKDKLVSTSMAEELYNATKGDKKIYIFPRAGHASSIFFDAKNYKKIVLDFIHLVNL